MAVSLVTIEDLRVHAFALVALIEGVAGSSMISKLLADSLAAGRDELADDLETYWEVKVIRQTSPVDGDVYDVTEPPYDYHPGQFRSGHIPRWTLRRRPVVSVQGITFQFGPGGQMSVMSVPSDWLRVDQRIGTVSIVPIGTTAQIAAQHGMWFLPFFSGAQPAKDVPQFTAVDYTAGWYDPTGETLPEGSGKVAEGILQAAYLSLFNKAKRIIPASASVDGFSQQFLSIERDLELSKQAVQDFTDWWGRHRRPIRMVML